MRHSNCVPLLRVLLLVSGSILLPAPLCRAGLLNIQFAPGGPQFTTTGGSLTYDASTGLFSGTMVPVTYISPSLPGGGTGSFSSDSVLSFSFYVNSDGSFRSDPDGFNLNGTLNFDGTHISGSLLSGDFYAFGAEPPGPPKWVADALVEPTGGLLTEQQTVDFIVLPPQFPVGMPPVGIDFNANNVASGTLGDFTQSFSSTDVSGLVGLTVPEPSTWVMAATGFGATLLLVFRRRT